MRNLWMIFALLPMPLFAQNHIAGEFDYYVLSLSWSPNFCERIDNPSHPQCDERNDFGWVLHGLWPQYEQGHPEWCNTAFRPPSRTMTSAEAGLYGSSGSAWHQWRKHGVCSGLDATNYYAVARMAYEQITRPPLLRSVDRVLEIPPSVIEAAFLEVNKNLESDQITITCKDSQIQEARICMTRELELRRCGSDVIKDCTRSTATFSPIP